MRTISSFGALRAMIIKGSISTTSLVPYFPSRVSLGYSGYFKPCMEKKTGHYSSKYSVSSAMLIIRHPDSLSCELQWRNLVQSIRPKNKKTIFPQLVSAECRRPRTGEFIWGCHQPTGKKLWATKNARFKAPVCLPFFDPIGSLTPKRKKNRRGTFVRRPCFSLPPSGLFLLPRP